MATADEILSQLAIQEDKVLVINNDLRTITIPMSVKMLGVESDEDVLRLRFRMPRMCGDTDLSDFVIRINYVNANGIGDIYYADDTFVDEDAITFSWLIGRNVTMYKGDVHFVVCLKLYDDAGELTKEYNTTISSLPVLDGLEVSDVIIRQNPDIIELILLRLNKLEESDGKDGGYYAPSVDGSGNLTWTASKSDMPAVSGANIQGPKGKDGHSPVVTATKSGKTTTISVDGTAIATVKDGTDGKSAYQYAVDGGYTKTEAEFAEKLAQEQLSGTTNELTPTQVHNAVSAGIPVKVQYIDSTYGLLSFTAFNVAESLNVIVSQTIVYYNSQYILSELFGNKSNNIWGFNATTLAQKTDIPSALPNANALTFTGAVIGSYDGTAPMTVNIPSAVTDDHINSLIDTKLGVIENGSY